MVEGESGRIDELGLARMVLEASRDVSPVSLPRAYQSRAEVKRLARIRACGFESHSPNYGGVFHIKLV